MTFGAWRADTMSSNLVVCLCAVVLLAVLVPARAQEASPPPPKTGAAESSQPATADGVPEATQETEMSARELAGTSWRLVNIMSTDDNVYAPDDPSKYTLGLRADGTAAVLADCNRGTGNWTSTSTEQLQFGPIATTRALCPPGSLSERYLAQFQWVRSYVMENGHLYLATMADGSIIEFEPMELPLAATVLGEEVRTSDASEMQRIVLTRLFNRYAEEQGIEVSDAEIDTYVENMRRGMRAEGLTAEDDLTPEEAA